MSPSRDLVVLGGGPAGLAAAWFAARRGLAVTLLERAPAVGGMAASFEVAGVRVDHGSHRLHPATPAPLLAELRGLLGADLQTRPRRGRLRLAGSWVDFPLRPAQLARALPAPLLAAAARDAVLAPFRAPVRRSREDSYAAVLRTGLGPALYEALYAPYAEKLWGLPGAEIDGAQARVRVTADTPWKVAARMLRGRAGGGSGRGRVFHYPRRGFGQITEALAEAATAAGAQVRTRAHVVALDAGPDGVTARLADGGSVRAGRAFSTLPLPVLARIARPGAPAAALEAAGRLRFRAMVLVYLVHAGGRWSPYDAHYLPGPQTPVTRISEPANYRVSRDDPADRSVLCAEIPCDPGDPVWSAPDEDLAAIVEEAFRRTGLPPVSRAGVAVRRLRHVYPVYARGYAAQLAGLQAWAATVPRVTTFGRLGLFAHDNTHHALVMARDAVDALGAGGWDAAAWARAGQRFAAHVVED